MEHDEPVLGDAFGAILRAYWAGGGRPGVAYEVVERDDGHIFVDDAQSWFTTPEQWHETERRACDRAAGRVLDIGCGAGRHAVVLAAQGIEVVGLDTSPGAVAISRERGVAAQLGSVTQPNESLGRFDTFLMLGNNLGLLGSAKQAHEVLTNLARLAQPGARLYGTNTDPHKIEVPAEKAYQDRNRQQGRMPGQTRLRIRTDQMATDWFDYLFLSPSELAELTTGTGWTLADVTTSDMHFLAELHHSE
jgi:SAM-dependent methyltransferase